jgi:hypothetical protein
MALPVEVFTDDETGSLLMRKTASPVHAAASSSTAITAVQAGRREVRLPTQDQTRDSSRPGRPTRGTCGQNTHRPQTSSSEGRKVSWAISAQTMPTAPIGPSPCRDADCAASRHTIPTVMVPAEASSVGMTLRRACAIASSLAACWRSSSRYRWMSSSA